MSEPRRHRKWMSFTRAISSTSRKKENFMIRVALFLSALLAGTLSAQVSTSTVTLTVDPTQTLSDLYFLYTQGDISRAFPLMGDAPANTSTQFDISAITAD